MSKPVHTQQNQEAPMKVRFFAQNTSSLLAVVFATTLLIGCQFAPKNVPKSWSWSEEEKPVVPDRILAIWTDTVLRQPNQPGVRGFGGRVFFYEKDENDPIEVDGKLVVFVFDADDQDPENQKPLRKYVIEADDFAKHMSKTSIGPAYSVWLPWGDVKGPTMKLSIIARYEGRKGGITISDPTIKLLPGVEGKTRKMSDSPSDKPLVESRSPSSAGSVKQAGYETPATADPANAKENAIQRSVNEPGRLPASPRAPQTIELPPSFQRHFQRPEMPSSDPLTHSVVPEITRSQVTTEVIDARSQKLGTFKKAYSETTQAPPSLRRSPTSRIESLRSGKSISKKTDQPGMFPDASSSGNSKADSSTPEVGSGN
jgi:hypothetical protein